MNHFWEVVDVAKERLGSTSSVVPSTGRKTLKVKATSNTAPISTGLAKVRPKSAHNEDDDIEETAVARASSNENVAKESSKKVTHQRRHHTHHIFDHFHHHHRPRAKSTANEDDIALASTTHDEPVKKSSSSGVNLIRRWSETSNSKKEPDLLSNVISIGSSVKVLVDYRPVKDDEIGVTKGLMVEVLDVDSQRGGYLVRKQDHSLGKQEGWVPTYVLNLLTSGPRRQPWTFRKFRKPSFSSGRKDSSPSTPPAAQYQFPITAKSGDKAVLSCTLPTAASDSCVLWRGPHGDVLLPGSHKYATKTQGRVATLLVAACEQQDAGDYVCSQVSNVNEDVLFAASVSLTVLSK